MYCRVIALLGPTATGKTALSVELAKTLQTEIISADSMQIYKHMDIGTAKPTKMQRQGIAHHMIDVVEPWQGFSAGAYLEMAKPIFENLLKSQRYPIVVGGTGLYFRAMTKGLFEGFSADSSLRQSLMQEELKLPGSLYKKLQVLDPETASQVNANDIRRIIRALEVCILAGQKISTIRRSKTTALNYQFIKIGLTMKREKLYDIINDRVDKMLKDGLLDEVRYVCKLISEHVDTDILTLPSMQAIGYKELVLHDKGLLSYSDAIALIKQKSRNYAKRQWTWFKKDPEITWIDVTNLHTADVSKGVLDILKYKSQVL